MQSTVPRVIVIQHALQEMHISAPRQGRKHLTQWCEQWGEIAARTHVRGCTFIFMHDDGVSFVGMQHRDIGKCILCAIVHCMSGYIVHCMSAMDAQLSAINASLANCCAMTKRPACRFLVRNSGAHPRRDLGENNRRPVYTTFLILQTQAGISSVLPRSL